MSARVFVVQMVSRLDHQLQQFVPKYDLSAAKEHGELVYLLGPTAAPWRADSTLNEMHEKLKDFSDDDYLLLIGNPVFIGMATAIAAEYNQGCVRFLQWSGSQNRYIPILVQGLFTAAQPM